MKIQGPLTTSDLQADASRLSAISVTDGDRKGRTYLKDGELCMRYADGEKLAMTPEMALRMEWDVPDYKAKRHASIISPVRARRQESDRHARHCQYERESSRKGRYRREHGSCESRTHGRA